MKSVTPLPPILSDNIIQRLIEIDEALVPYVSGALSWLCDKEPFEETGALTVETAKEHFSEMLWTYFQEQPAMIPVGATMMWHLVAPPDRWLPCNGAMVAKADYPELWALWGDTFGASTTDLFAVVNMTDRSPFGQSGFLALNAVAGALTHTLTVAQMPVHNHAPLSPSTSYIGNKSGGTNTAPAGSAWGASATTENAGGNQAHNNLHPVIGVNYIVYAGRP
jgi:microcystin-dependent protein